MVLSLFPNVGIQASMNMERLLPFWAKATLLALFSALLLFLVSKYFLGQSLAKDVPITAYVTVPLFLITLLQIAQAVQLQKAAFVKDYIARFFTDGDLYTAWHDLIYTYKDDIFERIDKACKNAANAKPPHFESFEEHQDGRSPGRRYYHPRVFQGSEEERRLDGLLGFFDVIGYHYHRGLLPIQEVAWTIGYHLSVMATRKVFQAYMELNVNAWPKETDYTEEMGAPSPYSHLRALLEDLRQYNKKHAV